jgi:hypothetical protein
MRKRIVVSLTLAACLLGRTPCGRAQTVPCLRVAGTEAERVAEQNIYQRLSQPMDFEFVDAPLTEVVAYLERQGVPVWLDVRSLDDIGLAPDSPVRFRREGISLRSALALMLDTLDLTWTIRHETLAITTREGAESFLKKRVYDVSALVPQYSVEYRHSQASHNVMIRDFQSLIIVITEAIEPECWEEFGGAGMIEGFELPGAGVLVVSQTDQIQDQVAQLLNSMLQVAVTRSPAPSTTAIRGSARRISPPHGGSRLSSVSIARTPSAR